MSKAPAFQFYVKDWLSDPQLKMVSHNSKGIWIDLLCFMWESNDRGILEGKDDQFCKMLGCNAQEWDQFINEASVTKFADVTKCNGFVTVKNRRMFRDEKERKNTRLRVQRFRSNAECNTLCNDDVTLASSSSSPLKENIIKEKKVFGEFQNVNIADTEFEKLLARFGEIGVKDRIENLSRYIASKGKKYKSHYATILSWENKNAGTTKPKSW